MATTNNVVIANFPPTAVTTSFNIVWKLTRALLKAGWKYWASSDGSATNLTGDPASDKWNGTAVTTNVGATASITLGAITRGRITVTGLTGITTADKGRYLVISGSANAGNNHRHQIEEYVSATSVKIAAHDIGGQTAPFTPVAETASLTWSIIDPSSETYATITAGILTTASWHTMIGPSIIRIPITAAQVAGGSGFNFIRGENVTQATTGAEGGFRGYVFDSTTSTGYILLEPRVRGTGGGVYGFATTNVLTGALTGATVTQVGTAIQYVAEMSIWKGANETAGQVQFGWFDTSADSTDRYTAAARLAAVTATVGPGGGSGANAQPAFGWVAVGVASTTTTENWNRSTSTSVGNGQNMVADAIEESGYSADGSWWCMFSTAPGGAVAGSHGGFGFQILDDTEDGDVMPYVSVAPGTITLYANTRTSGGTGLGSINMFGSANAMMGAAVTSEVSFRGWRRRGLSSGDQFIDMEAFQDWAGQSGNQVPALNAGGLDQVSSAPVTTKIREALRVGCISTTRKIRKGTLRWLGRVQNTGGAGEMFSSGLYVQMSSAGTYCGVIGPWNNTALYTAS